MNQSDVSLRFGPIKTQDVKKGIGTFGFFGPEIAQANSYIAVGLERALS